jgi:hypothetical protein
MSKRREQKPAVAPTAAGEEELLSIHVAAPLLYSKAVN